MKRKSDKVRAEALRLFDAGVSPREIATQLAKKFKAPLAESTIRNWHRLRMAPVAPTPAPVEDAPPSSAPPPAPPPELPDVPEDGDLVTQTRAMLHKAQALSARASEEGNFRAAQQAQRDALNFTGILARLEKDRRGTEDGVFIPRAELERVRKAMTDRVAALAADLERTGGLVCSHCGREIRMQLAQGDAPGKDVEQ